MSRFLLDSSQYSATPNVEWKLDYQKELFEKREHEKLELEKIIRKLISFSWITIATNKIALIWKQKKVHGGNTQPQLFNELAPDSFEKITNSYEVPLNKEDEINYRLAEMKQGRGLNFHLWGDGD